MKKSELEKKYGKPKRIKDDVPGRRLTFLHETKEAAQAYADANIEYYDHSAWVEQRPEGWVSIVDLETVIATFDKVLGD